MDKTIYEIVKENSLKEPEKIAIFFEDSSLTYSELIKRVNSLSYSLLQRGIGEGDHFAFCSHNSIEFALILLSASQIGAVIAPLPPGIRGEALIKALLKADCKAIIAPADTCELALQSGVLATAIELQEIEAMSQAGESAPSMEIDPCSDYILTMTSGSTGDPKPILFTQKTKVVRALIATADVYDLDSGSVVLTSTPMHHSLAQRSTLLPLMLGGTAVIMRRFTPSEWIDTVIERSVTFLFAVSNQLEILLDYCKGEIPPMRELKTIVSSSALLKDETKLSLLKSFDCRIDECYGTSEIGVATNISMNNPSAPIGSVGKPLPHVEVKITDSERNTLPPGAIGEIACSTLTRFSRYYGDENATRRCFDKEGYFYTGDLGVLDEEGWLFYRGRNKDLIITGGINVYPQDIEEVLAKLPDIAESAVIGVDDSYFGEAVLAVLVPVEGAKISLSKVIKHCRSELAEYQQPLAYEIVDALPRNPMGKLLKEDLRARFKNYDASAKMRAMLFKKGESL